MRDCKKCPESIYPEETVTREDILKGLPDRTSNTPLPELEGVGKVWIIYTGGPPEAHLSSLRYITPDNIKVGHTGSLEYQKKSDNFEPPKHIDGYQRDKENDHLFLPVWKSCVVRHFNLSSKSVCNCVDVIARCGKTFQIVKCADCDQCEYRVKIPELKRPVKKTLKSLQYPVGLPIHNPK